MRTPSWFAPALVVITVIALVLIGWFYWPSLVATETAIFGAIGASLTWLWSSAIAMTIICLIFAILFGLLAMSYSRWWWIAAGVAILGALYFGFSAANFRLPGVTGKAEDNFVVGNLPDCVPVNGPWLEAFGNHQTYTIDPASAIFNQSAFNYFEGVVVPSNPTDLHSVFQMKDKFTAEQGNVWTCGVVTDSKVQNTILFQSTDKKWQNWSGQPDRPFHAMQTITDFGTWNYLPGVKPAWALGAGDSNLVCPFAKPALSDPAGKIQPDGSFIGAPGKAGCDFVAVGPDGTALRYHNAIDSFPYAAGTRFFLFAPSLSNQDVASAINVGTVTDGK